MVDEVSQITSQASLHHPLYAEMARYWQTMEHCYEGDAVVKDHGPLYLPATQSMLQDGAFVNALSPGHKAYQAYKLRALYPDNVRETVSTLQGLLHRKPAIFNLPTPLQRYIETATPSGEGLQGLLMRITHEQLLYGRVGLLVDIVDSITGKMPMILLYRAFSIVSWDDDPLHSNRRFLILDQSGQRPDEATLTWQNKLDVLTIRREGSKVSFTRDLAGTVTAVTPSFQGRSLSKIPFVFININDLVARPERPPLIGLANVCLAIYRAEADYRHSLFMQGQDTLVVKGVDAAPSGGWPIGAGFAITLGSENADAKFIGVGSAGLMEQRQALENDKREAAEIGGKLIESKATRQESDSALRTRIGAKSATLIGLATVAAKGLQESLQMIGEYLGLSQTTLSEISIIPNTDFMADQLTGQDLNQFAEALVKGAPLSKRSLHENLVRRDMTHMTYDEEIAAIQEEQAQDFITPDNNQGGNLGAASNQGP